MVDRPRACIDRPLPTNLRADVVERQRTPWYARPEGARAGAPRSSLWVPGQIITLSFLRTGPADGDAAIIERRVRAIAEEWKEHANLVFRWNEPNASIRIAFENSGSWSFIGTECLAQAEGATMNFGWLSPDLDDRAFRSVVLHEFGHALGMIHEHQSPSAKINWNREAVYAYYEGEPNHWSPAEVERNLFETYDTESTQFTAFDPHSIMMYPIPAEHRDDGDPVGWNTELSDADKTFVEGLYPRPITHP